MAKVTELVNGRIGVLVWVLQKADAKTGSDVEEIYESVCLGVKRG